MSTEAKNYCYEGEKSFTLVKWKVRSGSQLFYNTVILNYKHAVDSKTEGNDPLLKYKSTVGGTVLQLIASEGDVINSGACLLQFEPCSHPVIMKDLCAECGADLRDLDGDKFAKLTAATTFSMVHVVPELKVSLEQAEKLGKDDENRLLKNKKLVLLVDLDQTLIHTTNDNVLPNLKDVYHFQLYGQYSPWYHTKFRPGTRKFLDNISKYYELHICTFGARLYAHKIAQLLDPDGKLFSHRILSRDECFDATSKTGNLKALFPRGDSMVCIIDDREDVWNFAPNVIHVKPYCFFRNTGDINAPPGFRAEAPREEQQQPCQEQQRNQQQQDPKQHEHKQEQPSQQPLQNQEQLAENQVQNQEQLAENQVQNQEQLAEQPLLNQEQLAEQLLQNQELLAEQPLQNQELLAEQPLQNQERSAEQQLQNQEQSAQQQSVQQCERQKPPPQAMEPRSRPPNEHFNEAADNDDYLLYLEEILLTVHKAYYDIHEQMVLQGEQSIPDLKTVVPYVRQKVLKGINLVFSSLIPTNCPPENSRLWTLAVSLGAHVSRDLELEEGPMRTTHVVASKLGTAKLNAAKKHRNVFVVSLDWLLCCAERWEKAEERMFPLRPSVDVGCKRGPASSSGKRPCGSNSRKSHRHQVSQQQLEQDAFSERIFAEAGLSLSKEEIADMDREVEEACSGGDTDGSSAEEDEDDSDDDESLSSGDYPKCWKHKRRRIDGDVDDLDNGEKTDELSNSSDDAETIGSVDDEMAAAVEREFSNY